MQIATNNTKPDQLNELFYSGVANSPVGEIELDTILHSVARNELVIPILHRFACGDLSVTAELRTLIKGIASQKISEKMRRMQQLAPG